MRNKLATTLIAASILVGCNGQKTVKKLITDNDKASYAIGMSLGKNLKNDKLSSDINYEVLSQALRDVRDGNKLLISEDTINHFMEGFIKKHSEKLKGLNADAGEKFLADNKVKKGVITTASGLQYEVIKQGDGVHPTEKSTTAVTYKGSLLNGTVFDGTEKNNGGKPTEFPVNAVIPGWQEGIKLMSKGAKYKFYIPSELAYGDKGAGGAIGPNEVLTFEVELFEIKDTPVEAQQPQGTQAVEPMQVTPQQLEQLKKEAAAVKNK